MRVGGAPTPLGRAPPASWPPFGPPTYPLYPYIPTYRKTSKTEIRSGVPPPEASVATESQSRPVLAPCRRGESLFGGHLHHPGALHDEEGVVLPRGWGYVPVAMCLISLSLSLSCSWGDTILMYRELCYYSWILWCFSPIYSLVMNWVSPLKLSYRIESFMRTLDVCLAVIICGDNGISCDSLDVCFGDQFAGSAHEPMHRGWYTFSSWFSDRNIGVIFEVLCVGWIDESESVWCISYNHTHGYLRWQWSI